MKPILKRMLSGVLSTAMTISAVPIVSAHADESEEPYPYTLFAASGNEGAITVNAGNACINGSIATNGTIASSGNLNINGTRTEQVNEKMPNIIPALNASYFSGENVETYTEDYVIEELNISINNPIDVDGVIDLTGNINLNSGIKAADDVTINGEVKNSNNAVICSETGDINIETNNVSFSGLIYAPYGDIVIDSDNLCLNNVVIIGQTITIDCPNVNLNYNSAMASFIGSANDTNIDIDKDIDAELYAFGSYNADNNAVDIEWYSNYSDVSYEVLYSDDNEEYTSLAIETDATTYQYTITEDFDKRYFKVVLITENGEKTESIPFTVTKSEDGYEAQFFDSDEDGLPDILEISIGTDLNTADTDEDGLTDYQEYLITKTDPLVYDSIAEGTSDADADSDEDGISNIDEINLGTDPLNTDTDDDGLSDYDEVNVYNTDPLSQDSDNDGIEDGSEIKLGLDPADPETFGVPDGEYQTEQSISIDSPILSNINTEDSPYELSVDIKTNLDAEKELSIVHSSYSAAIQNDAMLGDSLDLSISDECEPENIVIKYSIKEDHWDNTLDLYSDYEELRGLKRLNIFRFDEDEKMLLPIDTEFDEESGTLFAQTDELGTYCVMDLEIWLNNLGAELISNEGSISDLTLNLNSISIMSDEAPATIKSSFKGHTYAIYDITGKSWDDASDMCEKLGGHLVTITTSEEQGFINSQLLKNCKNNTYWIGSKYVKNEWIWVTGEEFHFANWAKSEPSSLYDEHYVHIYGKIRDSISIGEWNNTFISNEHTGTFYDNLYCGFICEWDEYVSDKTTYDILLPTNWKRVTLDAKISPYNSVDTDRDTLTDWEEVDSERLIWHEDGSFELPVFSASDAVTHLKRFSSGEIEKLIDIEPKRYLPVISDPTVKDSDNDGLVDAEDVEPLAKELLKNYFIYYVRPTGEKDSSLEEPAKWMAEYAYNNENCVLLKVTSSEEFRNAWNNIIPKRTNTLHLYIHGEATTIFFFNGDNILTENIYNGKFQLDDKYVKNKVYLQSCNGGTEAVNPANGKYDMISAARAFAKFCPGTEVIALENGEVDFFNVTWYLPGVYEIGSMPIIVDGLAYQVYRNLDNRYNVFYPLRHADLGEWISIKYNADTQTFTKELLGDHWEL